MKIEIEEVLRIMARDGWNPRRIDAKHTEEPHGWWCAEGPDEFPMMAAEDGAYIPYSMLNHQPTFIIDAIDDSMKEACIDKGDQLTVKCGMLPYDGDIMVAEVDGKTIVHAYYEDENKWLIATNENMKPILLTEEMNVKWIGKVIKVEKHTPRISNNDCKRILTKSKVLQYQKPKISKEKQKHAIVMIAPLVEKGRQWYSVYRAMLDAECDLVHKDDFAGFCELVKKEVSNHKQLPTAQELQRMAVDSFTKPVKQWDVNDAPVKGARFIKYKDIAERMTEILVVPNSPEKL